MIIQVVISWPPSGRNPWKSAVSVLVWANPHVTILCWMTMGDRTFSGNNGKETVQNLFSLHLTPQDLAYAAAFDVIHTSIHSGISNAVLGGLSRRAGSVHGFLQ